MTASPFCVDLANKPVLQRAAGDVCGRRARSFELHLLLTGQPQKIPTERCWHNDRRILTWRTSTCVDCATSLRLPMR